MDHNRVYDLSHRLWYASVDAQPGHCPHVPVVSEDAYRASIEAAYRNVRVIADALKEELDYLDAQKDKNKV